ncbi:MAG: hypothetical protein ACRD3L_18195 [Terriglobales bacterium]
MKRCLAVAFCCLTLMATLAYAQGGDEGYQTATVVSIEKLAADAQHMENSNRYKISMSMGDTLYVCKASAPAATFMEWTNGKQFPARVSPDGKVLTVKNKNGQLVDLNIAKRKSK